VDRRGAAPPRLPGPSQWIGSPTGRQWKVIGMNIQTELRQALSDLNAGTFIEER
jgi:hypothetical protein